jgi:hypothetical protein
MVKTGEKLYQKKKKSRRKMEAGTSKTERGNISAASYLCSKA